MGQPHVKGINLVPTSSSNYSNVADGNISGSLTDDLVVQQSSGGAGGEVSLSVYGNVDADISLGRTSFLQMAGTVSGTVSIGELSGNLDIGELTGVLAIGGVSGLSSTIRIFVMSGGAIVGDAAGPLVVFLPSGIDQGASLSFGELQDTTQMDIGSGYGSGFEIAGTLIFQNGIDHATVNVADVMASSGIVNLGDDGVAAGSTLNVTGGSGNIVHGGDIEGTVRLGTDGVVDFTGACGFTSAASGSDMDLYGSADLYFTGSIDGDLDIHGVYDDNLCSSDLSGWGTTVTTLPANITVDGFGPNATICDIAACGAEAPIASGVTPMSRYISFYPENSSELTHIKVTVTDAPEFSINGEEYWVSPPEEFPDENSAYPGRTFFASKLQCERPTTGIDWESVIGSEPLYVYGAEIGGCPIRS